MYVSSGGIERNCGKIKLTRRWPVSVCTHTDIPKLLGLASHHRSFMPELFRIATPLRDLLKKDKQRTWIPNRNPPVLSTQLRSSPLLALPDFDNRTQSHSDWRNAPWVRARVKNNSLLLSPFHEERAEIYEILKRLYTLWKAVKNHWQLTLYRRHSLSGPNIIP